MKCLAILTLLIAVASAANPNIVFVLVDDWGYADVSFRNPAILTPNFEELVTNGLQLNRHYVFKYCSPSRASFLTGRWPHHAHQYNIDIGVQLGLNINMTTIADKLKMGGYKTHMVGKWHEGYYDHAHLPINRGFETSSGFLNGKTDHMTQVRDCATDFWKNDDVDPRNGTAYDAYLYREDLADIFAKHDPQTPFFLYLPLHNVHDPIEAPDEWVDLYAENSTCKERRVYQAMVSVADNVTGYVVELMKKNNMWDNTIMVVSADNGGAPRQGSNHPLKGSKSTFFEGGIRALAFANGGLIPDSMRGKSTDGFIHIADWYTTFCNLAGVDPSDSGPGKFPVDGKDVWPIITGESNNSSHEDIVIGFNFTGKGAIIAGNYKLIVGSQGKEADHLMWSPLDYPCSQGPKGEDCNPYCLYDIVNDPNEREELSSKKPDVLKAMLERYNAYSKEPRDMQDQGYHNDRELPKFNGLCDYLAAKGGYWRPWKD